MNTAVPLLAGVELGGTKCVCILGTRPDHILSQISIQTGEPAVTLAQINSVLDRWWSMHGPIASLGIASFGPLDLRADSPRFGRIISAAKRSWEGADIVGTLSARRTVPVAINTDVCGAAIAEGRWGAAQGLRDFAYITVGTGVGVGLIVGGEPVFGCNHPELGHIRVARLAADQWPGICPYHGDCVEGLAAGPAIAARAGLHADEIATNSPVWAPVTHTLSQLLHTIFLATAPRRILIGGGVMERRPELLDRVREQFVASLNGYLDLNDLTGGVDQYIVRPALGALAGPLGALALAAGALTA